MSYLRKVELWRERNRETERRHKIEKLRRREAGLAARLHQAAGRAHGGIVTKVPAPKKLPAFPMPFVPDYRIRRGGPPIDLVAVRRGLAGRPWYVRLARRLKRLLGFGPKTLGR